MADALNDMMGGSSEKGAVKVNIVVKVDVVKVDFYSNDDGGRFPCGR